MANQIQVLDSPRDTPLLLSRLRQDHENDWIESGQKMALELFHAMSRRVPAYKDFLKQHNINPESIKTTADLAQVPTISKDNYLRAYPLEQLCWDGNLKRDRWVI